ncbi:MAG: hypothetical protein V7707_04105 [Motiliproteus sp.]
MSIYRLIAVLILTLYLLSPSMVGSWSDDNRTWYSPFLIWLLLIVITAWLELKRSRDDV